MRRKLILFASPTDRIVSEDTILLQIIQGQTIAVIGFAASACAPTNAQHTNAVKKAGQQVSKKSTLHIVRQGDVLLIEVAFIPNAVQPVPRDKGRIVLAYGEVTGHAHAILDREAELVRTDEGSRFLRIMASSGVELQHEEHSTAVLDRPFYKVIQQVEYVPQELPRAVMD